MTFSRRLLCLAAFLTATLPTAVSHADPATLIAIDGATFPDHMVSLFYDDGPDTYTLAPARTALATANANYLANYLHSMKVSATFDVVGAMPPFTANHQSPTPARDGTGYLNYSTGYPNLFLQTVVQLGHRLGNHTLNHIPLDGQDTAELIDDYAAQTATWPNPDSNANATIQDGIHYQVDRGLEYLAPYISNNLFIVTPPGGRWSPTVSEQALAPDRSFLMRIDPNNAYKIGTGSFVPPANNVCGEPPAKPILVNSNDYCYARLGYSATVYAQDLIGAISQYTASHEEGFYIFNHDRNVGALGTPYALNIAKQLVPYLLQNGYVFVGPMINFSATMISQAFPDAEGWMSSPSHYDTFRSADINGDGRTDVCARGAGGMICSLTVVTPSTGLGISPVVQFGPEQQWDTSLSDANGWNDDRYASTIMLADVNGDGKADLIVRTSGGIMVALSNGHGFQKPTMWLTGANSFSNAELDPATGSPVWLESGHFETFRAADVNGDGYADICARGVNGIVCAINNRKGGFSPYTLWETTQFTDAAGWNDTRYASTIMLADVNGDGKADLIARGAGGLFVYLSTGNGFAASATGPVWSRGTNFTNTDVQGGVAMNWLTDPSHYKTFRAVDINGDGKADICARGPKGIVCVLSNGQRFLKETNWEFPASPQFTDANGWNDVGHASTIMLGDTNGDGRADIIGKNVSGLITGFAP